MNATSLPRIWAFEDFRNAPGPRPLLMGIVNVTPDSFSDGGLFLTADAAVDQALKLIEEGADILDIGGESTRPGSAPVPDDDEVRRVVPVIERLAALTRIPISIDTSKPAVARAALHAGARIVNDIAGLRNPNMIDVCCQFPCGIVCMHMQGTPQTMQLNPQYAHVVSEICDFFEERLHTLAGAGIDPDRVAFDPGVGFGKTAQHNIEILNAVSQFQSLGRPILVGHSRKRFLQKVIGRAVDERLFGTVGVSVALAHQGVDILRVHDVAANRDAINAFMAATRGQAPPARGS